MVGQEEWRREGQNRYRQAVRAWHSSWDVGARQSREATMLMTILVLLLILWLLGVVSSYTLGGFIHILLILAIAIVLIRVIQGRNPV
jgi:hypothetical protein